LDLLWTPDFTYTFIVWRQHGYLSDLDLLWTPDLNACFHFASLLRC